MHVKTGDKVIVISGKDKGKIGKIVKAIPKDDRVIVEGVNIQTKHQKPKGPQSPGGIVKVEGPIHVSKVLIYSEKEKKGSRIGYKFLENGKKVRYTKIDGNVIDK